MELFFASTVFGLYIGSAYAIAASGLVLTYTTTRIFNLAQGALSMVMAYLYWQLHVHDGLSVWLSIAIVVLVAAPLMGFVLDRVMRGLSDAPVSVMLVVTVALFMALIGIATQVWPTTENRAVNYFFGYNAITIFGVAVGYHYLITIAAAALIALALYLLLNRTQIGIAMRAAVDNRELLELFGVDSRKVTVLSWMIGCQLAAAAGILLVAYTGVDYYSLTFLVIASFSAAMLGRLKSLPWTYVGALLLGVGGSYCQSYLTFNSYLQTGIQSSLPTFLLFFIVISMPQVRLRVGQVKGILAASVPKARRSRLSAVLAFVCVTAVASQLGGAELQKFGLAIVFGIIMLSMVLLTGYGGYLSLAQFSFVGIGAATVAKMHTASPSGLLVAVMLAAAAGALVALSVLRLTGLYLALATLAFGQLMDKLVFNASFVFGVQGSLPVKRIHIPGLALNNDSVYVVFMFGIFLLLALLVLGIRRGPLGRILIALRDSPQASGTLGLNQGWLRVALFTVSAGICGLAGALMAGLQELAAPASFGTIASLPTVLVAVVAGITTISGALVGGFMLMFTLTTTGGPQGMVFIVLAVGAVLLAKDPNGLVNLAFKASRSLARRVLPRHFSDGADVGIAPPGDGDHGESTDPPVEIGAHHGVA